MNIDAGTERKGTTDQLPHLKVQRILIERARRVMADLSEFTEMAMEEGSSDRMRQTEAKSTSEGCATLPARSFSAA